jgi:Carboxypeptidase regulatory-like domain
MSALCNRKKIGNWISIGLLLLLSFSGAQRVYAQLSHASINGTVRDSSGAVIPGAQVLLRNVNTGIQTPATTNDAGVYVIQNIIPGTYTLQASNEGFKTTDLARFELVVNQSSVFDLTLNIGAENQTVTVSAEGSQLQTASADLGTVITAEQISALPLGRNALVLMQLTPGVSMATVGGQARVPSVNGQMNRSNQVMYDDVSNTAYVYTNMAYFPLPEEIGQFKVESHNDTVLMGGVLGGTIQMVSKSGTNDFHGSVWEWEGGSSYNATNNAFAPGAPKPKSQDHKMGGIVGGPVWIPKIYNGHDKTFFSVAYQRELNPGTTQNWWRVPTDQELDNGDFSDLVNSGCGYSIFDPQTETWDPTAGGGAGGYVRKQFGVDTGTPNVIPTSRFAPGMSNFIKTMMPRAGAPISYGGTNCNNVYVHGPSNTNNRWISARIDHKFRDTDTAYGRFSTYLSNQEHYYGFKSLDWQSRNPVYQTAFGWIHNFGSKATLLVTYGTTINYADTTVSFVGADPKDMASQMQLSDNIMAPAADGKSYFPMYGVLWWMGEYKEHNQDARDQHFRANYSRLMGRHLIQAGGEYHKLQYQYILAQTQVSYSGGPTSAGTDATDRGQFSSSGNTVASFLLGYADGVTRYSKSESIPASTGEMGFYASDAWKVSSKLDINFGLRYDFANLPSGGTEKDNNNKFGTMDFDNGVLLLQAAPPSCATTGKAPCIPVQPGGAVLPDHVVVSSDGKLLHNTPYNIQPRFGFAYRADEKTVLRGGFGMFFDNYSGTTQMARNPIGTWPSIGALSQAENAVGDFYNGRAVHANDPLSLNATMPATTPFPADYTQSPLYGSWQFDPRWKNPYSYQYNLGIQRQMTPVYLATINYVGSNNRRTNVGGGYNTASPGPTAPGHSLLERSPRPYMTIPYEYDRSIGHSNYNALQLSLERRFTNGLGLTLSYTWGKAMDLGNSGKFGFEGISVQNPYDLKNDWSVSVYDVTHSTTLSYVYQLPWGTGQRYSTGNRVVDYIVGNWKVSGITYFRSGYPVNPTAGGADTANIGYPWWYERSNRVSGVSLYARNRSRSQWLNPTAFAMPDAYTFGTAGRNILRAPFVNNSNMAISRQFPIRERLSFDIRAETANTFNQVIYGAPDADITSPTFGKITGTAVGPRTMTIGGYINF